MLASPVLRVRRESEAVLEIRGVREPKDYKESLDFVASLVMMESRVHLVSQDY
ncbi:hypothetical protein PoB_001917700, partial [Plakobranchus ocellatus]